MNAAPPSPCCGVCRMEAASGRCAGCWRTLDEIARWSTADAAWKQALLDEIAGRRAAAGHAIAPALRMPSP